ncbi:MAG: hypothetical protein V4717_10520 [Bacteroidota bacterium]
MNNFTTQNCPICQCKVEFSANFPDYVCNACASNATDIKGEKVIFYHTHLSGQGYQGYYRRNQELIPFTGNDCYINGIKCNAIYDHLGGVLLHPVNTSTINTRRYESRHATAMS